MNLEQQKKQARELLLAIRRGDAEALSRLRRHHTRWTAVDEAAVRQLAALHDAQFVLAREQGFASWPKLKAYAEPSPNRRHTRLFVADLAWIEERADGLLRTRQSAGPAALEQIREWHPRFRDCTDGEILAAPFTVDDARLVYAREHGFDTWAEFANRVHALAGRKNGAASTEPFLAAFEALQSRNVSGLRALLRAHAWLAHERGTNGNTLLNLAASLECKASRNGGEILTAARPEVDMSTIEELLEAGADVNEGNDRGWTPLHQAAYSNQPGLAARLIRHGARWRMPKRTGQEALP